MKLRILVLAAIAMLGFCFAPSSQAQTTTVRGQLLRNGQTPAPGIQVTLYNQAFGRSSPTATGADGMYHFANIPFGEYYLEVWLSNPPKAYQVHVTTSPFNDLPRIPIP